jgi:transcriptional regulator with XRE-family HTH domain
MMPTEHPSADRRRLAAALREDAGLSAERLAELLCWSPAKVSRIENGHTMPRARDAAAWASAVSRPDRGPELAALLIAAAARSEEAGGAEWAAEVARVLQPAVIPGLLRTAGRDGMPCSDCCHARFRLPEGVPHLTVNWAVHGLRADRRAGGYHNRQACGTDLSAP